MKRLAFLTLTLIFLLAGNSMAITWHWAGHLFDQNVFDPDHNDKAPITYPGVPPYTPSPGGAQGEKFDFEGAKFGMDNDYLYFAMTNSFGMGTMYDGYLYEVGDLFFTFNDVMEFGIDYYDGGLYMLTAEPFGIPVTPAGYYNNPSIAAAVGAYAIDTENSLYFGDAEGWMHTDVIEHVAGDTYVLEIRIAKSLFGGLGVDFASLYEVSVHQTISCGNDFIDDDFPVTVIPEPCTMALLGLGLLGSALIARRKM